MMWGRVLVIFLIIFSLNTSAQEKVQEVLGEYPPGQFFYIGGELALRKEMVAAVKKEKLLPCENTEESYTVNILVNPDSSINYIKDFDTATINKNKCAYDFSRKVIPHLKRWIAAKENDSFIGAVVRIQITPFILYHSKDDPRDNKFIETRYKDGRDAFAEEVRKNMERLVTKNEDKRIYLTFIVNEEGGLQDFLVEGNCTDYEKRRVVESFSKMKGKWVPATFNGIRMKSKMRVPITQQFNVEFELEKDNLILNRAR